MSIFNCLFIFTSLVITDDVLWVWFMHKDWELQSLDLHPKTYPCIKRRWMNVPFLYTHTHTHIYKICVFPILIDLKINLPRTVSNHLRTEGFYFKCQANYGHREWDGGESPCTFTHHFLYLSWQSLRCCFKFFKYMNMLNTHNIPIRHMNKKVA